MKYWRYCHGQYDYECPRIYGDFQGVFDTLEEAKGSPVWNDDCFVLVIENNVPVKEYSWVGNKWVETEIEDAKIYD